MTPFDTPRPKEWEDFDRLIGGDDEG